MYIISDVCLIELHSQYIHQLKMRLPYSKKLNRDDEKQKL